MLGGGTEEGRFRLQQDWPQRPIHPIHSIHSILVLVTNREGVMGRMGGKIGIVVWKRKDRRIE
jgi:hypothetical protein